MELREQREQRRILGLVPGQPSPDGGEYLGIQDLDAYAPRNNVAGITQTIAGLQVGATYALSFYSMSNLTASAFRIGP